MAADPLRRISANCRRNRDQPNREHACTGCNCQCHTVAAPPNFRELVQTLKEDTDTTPEAAE